MFASTPDAIKIPGIELHRSLGRGGMGEVFLATQLSLGRLVAVKLLHEPEGNSQARADRLVRFRREAELMARASHPNVVTIHDLGEVDGHLYLVMEYVEGGDLRSRMLPGLAWPAERVREVVRPVVDVLAQLHEAGILHRDLKPENILLQDGVRPKVADFGIAVLDSHVGRLTETGVGLGTIGYVAPEQQYNLKVDERADQFSLAAVAYELLTGATPVGVLKAPTALVATLTAEADRVLMRALSESPSDRYRSIRDFGEAFDRALAGRKPTPWEHAPSRRTALVAAAVLAAFGAGVFVPRPRPPRPPDDGPPGFPGPRPPGPGRGEGPPPRPPGLALLGEIGLKMKVIQPGEFLMGARVNEQGADANEKPAHKVRLTAPFALAETEVTIGQFHRFITETGYRTTAEVKKNGHIWTEEDKVVTKPDANWRSPGYIGPIREDNPVTQVSWDDAQGFCKWLTRSTGRKFRLPTEAEWEYACRAGTDTPWSCGEDAEELVKFAHICREGSPDDGPLPVRSRRANPWGLYDMHGSVQEWCEDGAEFYPSGPLDVKSKNKPGVSDGRSAVRGGSWRRGVSDARSASRDRYRHDYPHFGVGFRVCSSDTSLFAR